jgi:RNA polymerase subunit RPABC4/transcription elongation factor Spt4
MHFGFLIPLLRKQMCRDYKSRLTALTKKLTESWSGFIILTHELWIFNPKFKNINLSGLQIPTNSANKKLTESWSGFVILTHELWIFNPLLKN